jgi:hypothetical protein
LHVDGACALQFNIHDFKECASLLIKIVVHPG